MSPTAPTAVPARCAKRCFSPHGARTGAHLTGGAEDLAGDRSAAHRQRPWLTDRGAPRFSEIDAAALSGGGPVLDVARRTSRSRGWPSQLPRRGHPGAGRPLHPAGPTFQACDVGVDVAENASDLSSRATATPKTGSVSASARAGRNSRVEPVRGRDGCRCLGGSGHPEPREGAITVRDNQFNEDHSASSPATYPVIEQNEFIGAHDGGRSRRRRGGGSRQPRERRRGDGHRRGGCAAGVIENNEIEGLTRTAS